MPTLLDMFTCIVYVHSNHSQKLAMVYSVYLSHIYIQVVHFFLTLGILLNVIVHVFLIFTESILALSQSESFCISIFK